MDRLKVIGIVLSLSLLAGCATSPTGQRQLRLFPDAQMARMGATAFAQTKSNTPLSKDRRTVSYVRCVTDALLREVGGNVAWEVQVFESKELNAFALPGGKIGIYTGLLKAARNQGQLATVIGHEIAHVQAEHGNARVSAAYATQGALQIGQILAGTPTPAKTQLFALLGMGAQYGVLLPYGRGQETESDILGLDLMARAGFDPRESVPLWRNMGAAAGGKKPPAFASTHPSNEQRIAELNRRIPAAMRKYAAAQRAGKRPNCRR